uniref:Uncharacterized protein n=1 Tax=Peromyscus maniculatus bairdii TaxID=230844 RepID=A0A8C9CRZ4_PERMB
MEVTCSYNLILCQDLPHPPKCSSTKCLPKNPVQCLPAASSFCATSSGGCSEPSSEGSCCLSQQSCYQCHRCWGWSHDSCGSNKHDIKTLGEGGCCRNDDEGS